MTYADFQTLQANYGSTATWWVNGDFNDDGTVNWADLNLLRQNLNPAGFTLSQFAQQALFGQGASVASTNPLEFDGYGVTYASGLPLSSTSGTVLANETSTGQQIALGGATYSEGLGFAGNSSTTIALNGQYSRVRQHRRRGRLELGRILGDLPGLRRWPAAVPVADPRERIRRCADRRERRGGEEPHARRGGGAGQLRIRRPRRLGRRPAGLHGQFRVHDSPTP